MAKKQEIDRAFSSEKRDEWFCIRAPEPMHFWQIAQPWDLNPIRKKGLTISGATISANETTGASGWQKLSKASPLNLDCGVSITAGRYGLTTQNRSSRFSFRTDSLLEFDRAMRELSLKYNYKIWKIEEIEFYNQNKGANLVFTRHSPNGVGVSLYLDRIKVGCDEKSYRQVEMYDQQDLFPIGDKVAACTMATVTVPACALEMRRRKPRMVKDNA